MQTEFTLVLLILGISFAYAGFSLAPWVPTQRRDVGRFIKILNMQKGDNFLELGSGDGRVSIAVAKKFPDNQVVGIEIFFPLFLISKLLQVFSPHEHLMFKFGDGWKQDFGRYNHIYVFGMPDKMQKAIVPKFLREAPKGAKLYSYAFSIPEEFQEHAQSIGDKDELKIHILEKR